MTGNDAELWKDARQWAGASPMTSTGNTTPAVATLITHHLAETAARLRDGHDHCGCAHCQAADRIEAMANPPADTSSLKGLIGRATPGPWEAQRYDESEEGLSIIAVIPGQETPTRGQVAWLGTIAGASFARPELCQANAELICKAVNALPWLIARSEQADRLEGALRAYHLATFAVIGEGGRRSWSVNPVALAKAYDLAAPLLSTLPPSQEEGK